MEKIRKKSLYHNDIRHAPIYKNPLSLAYWRDAAMQLKDTRILCIAAILIAVRVALKMFQIPVGPVLNIQIGFFVNALSATVIGPVVAVIAAFISDTVGVLVAGDPWIPAFAIVEIAGSFVFSVMLWRRKLTASRIILSRFFVVLVCNIILNPPLLFTFYNSGGKGYETFLISAIVKNVALYPIEAILLVLFFGLMVPIMVRMAVIPSAQTPPKLGGSHIALICSLVVLSVLTVIGYYTLYQPTQPKSVSVTEGSFKLTLKSERGAYNLGDLDPDAPLAITATLRNNGDTDIAAVHDLYLCDLSLIMPDGTVMTKPDDDAELLSTEIAANKSVKTYESFDWVYAGLGELPKGDYTVVADVDMTVGTDEYSITAELPISIK